MCFLAQLKAFVHLNNFEESRRSVSSMIFIFRPQINRSFCSTTFHEIRDSLLSRKYYKLREKTSDYAENAGGGKAETKRYVQGYAGGLPRKEGEELLRPFQEERLIHGPREHVAHPAARAFLDLNRAVLADHDHGHEAKIFVPPNQREQVFAAHAGHVEIGDDEIDAFPAMDLEQFFVGSGREDSDARPVQEAAALLQQGVDIFGNEDFNHGILSSLAWPWPLVRL